MEAAERTPRTLHTAEANERSMDGSSLHSDEPGAGALAITPLDGYGHLSDTQSLVPRDDQGHDPCSSLMPASPPRWMLAVTLESRRRPCSNPSSSPSSHAAMDASENRQASGLDGALADLLDLGLLAKQARWNVVGPRFRAMQLMLDELAEFARASADFVAERAVTLGHPPDGRGVTITTRSSLPDIEPGSLQDADAITTFVAILDAVATRIHSGLEAFERDLVSVGLLTRVLATVEKYAWMMRAQRCP